MTENSQPNFLARDYVFEKGLEPIDFVKHTLACEREVVDEVVEMGLGIEKMNLHKDHIYNVLTEEELSKLCFDRIEKIPSYISYNKLIATVLDIPEEYIPDGFLEAQMELSRQQSYGKRSYKNFLRRLKREYTKNLKEYVFAFIYIGKQIVSFSHFYSYM